MINAVITLCVGTFLTWSGWWAWKLRDQDAISPIEFAIFKLTGQEPLRRTAEDRDSTRFHAFFGMVFGPIMVVFGLFLIANAAGIL